MLELLKGFHGRPIVVPQRPDWRPDRERLADPHARFAAGASGRRTSREPV
jgi:hypothetical protein